MHCSGGVPVLGGVPGPGRVPAWGGCVPAEGGTCQVVSAQGSVCPEGGVWLGGVCPAGCLPRGVCPGGVPCDLSHHALDVTCLLPPHQLRPTNSAAAYILLAGHVTCKACWDTPPPHGQNS